ncbi:Endonuclease-reverse transcriptase, partial [Operophtera brumata]
MLHHGAGEERALCLTGPELCQVPTACYIVELARSARCASPGLSCVSISREQGEGPAGCGAPHAAASVPRWHRFLHCAQTRGACGRYAYLALTQAVRRAQHLTGTGRGAGGVRGAARGRERAALAPLPALRANAWRVRTDEGQAGCGAPHAAASIPRWHRFLHRAQTRGACVRYAYLALTQAVRRAQHLAGEERGASEVRGAARGRERAALAPLPALRAHARDGECAQLCTERWLVEPDEAPPAPPAPPAGAPTLSTLAETEDNETSYSNLESGIILKYLSIKLDCRDIQAVRRLGKKGERPRPVT